MAQLQAIQRGKLALYEKGAGSAALFFGQDTPGDPFAMLTVHDEKFWVRLALFADMVRLTLH